MMESPEITQMLANAVASRSLPPVYLEHPVAIASGYKAQPIAFYVDGVPHSKTDGTIGFWFYFILSPKKKRHLAAVVRKSKLCKCGCRGRCTFWVIFKWVHHSLSCMAIGEHASVDWKQCAFEAGSVRDTVAGTPLLFIAALVIIELDLGRGVFHIRFQQLANVRFTLPQLFCSDQRHVQRCRCWCGYNVMASFYLSGLLWCL